MHVRFNAASETKKGPGPSRWLYLWSLRVRHFVRGGCVASLVHSVMCSERCHMSDCCCAFECVRGVSRKWITFQHMVRIYQERTESSAVCLLGVSAENLGWEEHEEGEKEVERQQETLIIQGFLGLNRWNSISNKLKMNFSVILKVASRMLYIARICCKKSINTLEENK